MLWRSTLKSPAAFTKAVKSDPDFVFVTRVSNNNRERFILTVSGAYEEDPNMAVIGPNSEWRANINKEGRRLTAIPIKLPKRKERRMSIRSKTQTGRLPPA